MRRALALASLLTLASAWPLITHIGSAVPADLGDPILETWILWWNAHHLPFTAAWWNAPMFVPLQGTFAFSEALIAFVPLTTPLQWAGLSPVVTHNIAFILSGPAAFASGYVLAFRLTRREDASLIAALAFGFSPYRIAQMSHMQVLWSCWMPLALASLHSYLDSTTSRSRLRALVAFGVCWMMNGFTNGYFLVYFPVLVGIWLVWFARRWKDWLTIGATALLASLPIVPMLLGYAEHQQALGLSRQISEIREFSASLGAIVSASPRAWLSSRWTLPPGPEGELYPGLAVVGLIVWGLVIAARRRAVEDHGVPSPRRVTPRRLVIALALVAAALAVIVMLTGGSELSLGPMAISVHRPSRLLTVAFWLGVGAFATSAMMKRAWAEQSPFAFYAVAAGLMYLLALGPEPHAGATQILYKPPYAWLMYLPGFDSVRVPARFGLLMILCLTQAAALAWTRLTAEKTTSGVVFGKRHPTSFSVTAVATAIVVEGWIVMPAAVLPAPLPVPERGRAAGTMVMELPIETTYEANTLALLHAIDHKQPLINGFSGYAPPHYLALGLALKDGDPTALAAIREVGTIATFVDHSHDPNGVVAGLVAAAPGAELLETTSGGAWYLLPQLPRPVAPTSMGRQLTLIAAESTSTPPDAGPANLIDGKPNSRWHGHLEGETVTDTVTLSLGQPAVIDLLEVDQALWAVGFARDLEIVLVTDAGDVTAFRGPTGGLSVRAALLAPKVVTFGIPIRALSPARAIKLISHARGEKWTWSMGEVRIFAK